MPTVLRRPIPVFFYAEEGLEPPHVHIEAAERRAKFWMTPIEETWNDGFRSGEIKAIERILAANVDLLLEAWHDFFADQ